jgi:hypothetical protein
MAICTSHRANCIDAESIVKQLNTAIGAGEPSSTAQAQMNQGDGMSSKKSAVDRPIRQNSCLYQGKKRERT